MNSPVRPNVLGMTPYSPGKPIDEVKRELGLTEVVKLASNENPLGPSPMAMAAVRRAAETMHIYPDASGHDLVQAISRKFNVPAWNIVLGNGSDELIHLLGLVLIDAPLDEVVVGDPSFVRYDAAAQLAPCKLVKVRLDSGDRHDLTAMAAAVNEHTKLVFIANPNNPTGTIVNRTELDAFLRDLPERVVVALDEAYFEFAAHEPSYPNSLDYIRDGRSVIGLRTFSKAYGLAGIRLGFGFAPAAIADGIQRAREPFNVNALAQAAGIAALQDDEHLRRTLRANAEGMKTLTAAFEKHGCAVRQSYANFIFADIGRPAQPVFQSLLEQGVIVRSGHVLGCPTALRVSIGTPEENSTFVEVFDVAMRQPAGAR